MFRICHNFCNAFISVVSCKKFFAFLDTRMEGTAATYEFVKNITLSLNPFE